MTTWFVSRHPGAIAWARQNAVAADRWVEHFDPAWAQAGDTVIGTLPFDVAAAITEAGARFVALTLKLAREDRGKEINAQGMSQLDCRLVEYKVMRVCDYAP
ncbi:MAG: CRISPR-associated protein Csx16 [Duodenibacillus sp.]|nr:CRISPR-associated protein Csx16 [Duodenibacillus sp.]